MQVNVILITLCLEENAEGHTIYEIQMKQIMTRLSKLTLSWCNMV